MAKSPKSAKKRGTRRSSEQVQQLLGQIDSLRKAGEPLMKVLEKLGISYSNYNYWAKKRGGGESGRGKGRASGGDTRGGVFSVLDEMRANRAERHELEKKLRALDTKFNQLKFKLSRS
jgi:hypothetical protein